MFPKELQNETQIISFVLSYDGENDADVLGAIGASAALTISDVPFDGPMAEVRVGRVDGKFVINPTHEEVDNSDMELLVAGTEDSIMMVEGESKEVSEEELLDALKFAQSEIIKIVKLQQELREEAGKTKWEVEKKELDEDLKNDVYQLGEQKYKDIVYSVLAKEERALKNSELKKEVKASQRKISGTGKCCFRYPARY